MNKHIDAASSLAAPLVHFCCSHFPRPWLRRHNQFARSTLSNLLTPPQVEVIEFFAYGGPHCVDLETPFEASAKRQPTDVKSYRIPSNTPIAGVDSTVPI